MVINYTHACTLHGVVFAMYVHVYCVCSKAYECAILYRYTTVMIHTIIMHSL